jgi:competence protein ComEA
LLAGLAVILLGFHWLGTLRWGTRPSELERGLDYRIDLNRADRAELLQLPGVGENLAQRIIDYRQARGGFRRVEDLLNVHGVGAATLERLGPWIWVGRDEEEDRELGDRPRQVPPKRGADKPAGGGKFMGRPVRGSKEANLKNKININEASVVDLQKLPHIGPKFAERIIAERRKGRFRSVEDLRRVSGIGPKRLEMLRPYVTVGATPRKVNAGH